MRAVHHRAGHQGLGAAAQLLHRCPGVRAPGRAAERIRRDTTQHLLGNITVEVAGATARSICYFQAQHVRAGTPGGELYIIAGRYADSLERTPQGWRIAERVQTYMWRDGNRAVVAR